MAGTGLRRDRLVAAAIGVPCSIGRIPAGRALELPTAVLATAYRVALLARACPP
jgi:hypothetical protein